VLLKTIGLISLMTGPRLSNNKGKIVSTFNAPCTVVLYIVQRHYLHVRRLLNAMTNGLDAIMGSFYFCRITCVRLWRVRIRSRYDSLFNSINSLPLLT
jgi:hypothetical protein